MFVCYDNDNDALIPERWANESVALLEEHQVMARLVNRSFENEIKDFGDVVNTRKAQIRKGRRRTDTDEYTAADASSTNIRVPLDQWFYDSYVIKDGEASKSFKDLVKFYMLPAMQNIARQVDRAILGFAAHKSIKTPTTRSGRLGNLTGSTGLDFVTNADMLMNQQNALQNGRNLIVSAASKAGMLKVPEFTRADALGPGADALRTAQLGTILGFTTYMSQNTPYVDVSGAEVATGTVTNALAAGGSGSQTVSISGYEVQVGEYFTVAGNDQPTYATAVTASTNTTAVTANEANKFATSGGAVITVYKSCDVANDYAVGHSKEIRVDGHAANKGPVTGQLISFGTSSRHTYVIIEHTVINSTTTDILLDRPLEVLVANNDLAFPGPAGSMNPAFHSDAFALVTRPLAVPPQGLGAAGAVATYNDVSMRVLLQYDSKAGGTRVNFDVLAGLAVLDLNLASLMLG